MNIINPCVVFIFLLASVRGSGGPAAVLGF